MKYRKYPYELKKQVVELYFEGESTRELVAKFNIKNRRSVQEWVAVVKEHGYTALELGVPKSTSDSDNEKSNLKEENVRLKLENEYLKKLLELKRG